MRPIYFFFLYIATVSLAACHANGSGKDPQSDDPLLPVLTLHPMDTLLRQDYVADIQASRNVEIRAMVPGFIAHIFVDEGQEIRKGQPLFQINDEVYQTALAQASAALSNARAEAKTAALELKRVDLLVEKNIIARSEHDLAQSRLESAEAKIAEAASQEKTARIRLSYTHILAPFDGIIDRIPLKQGSLVSEGALLTSVSDLQSMYAYFTVSENEYLRYKRSGDTTSGEIRLVLADGTVYPHEGRIETMESEFDKSTGSIAFRARFPNPGKLLKHGATGSVRLTNRVPDALIIPQQAVFEVQDQNFVFLLDKGNTVKMRRITPGKKLNNRLIVQAGLTPEDRIVCEGIQTLREGATITPRSVSLDSLPSKNN